jgi:mono/diheme cytochrome c family protein
MGQFRIRSLWIVNALAFFAVLLRAQTTSHTSRSGEKLFTIYCQNCHSTAKDATQPPSLYHVMKRFDERQMRAIISNGKDTMPPFGRRLKPGELAKLIEYLKTL